MFDEQTSPPKVGNEPEERPKKPQDAPDTDSAKKDYEKKFNRVSKRLSRLEKAATDSDEDPVMAATDGDSNTEDLKTKEATPPSVTSTVSTRRNQATDGRKARPRIGKTVLGKLRQGSAFGFIIGIIVLGVAYASVFAPNIIMVNIKEMYTNDLADATVALHAYYKIALDQKLSGGEDCSDEESIKCKLTTMSRNQVKTLERHGFTVNGSKLKEDNLDDRDPKNDAEEESRWRVNSVTFPHGGGSASDGDSWFKAANKSFSMKELAYSVFNPQSSFFMDERFETRIKHKFDLTKIPTTGGATAKDVDESFDKSLKGPDEKFDEAGRAGIGLNALKEDEAGKQLKEVAKRLGALADTYTEMQCAYYTQGKIVYNSTKTAREHTAARFAMQYLKAADQIKSGTSDEITANTLSDKLAWSNGGGYDGKNATDSSLYRHIVLREGFKDSDNGTKYFVDTFNAIGGLVDAWVQVGILPTSSSEGTKGILGTPGNLTAPPADMYSKPREYCLHGETTQNVVKEKTPKETCGQLAIAAARPIAMAKPLPEVMAKLPQIIEPCRHWFEGGPWLVWPSVRITEPIVTPHVADEFNKVIKKWADESSKDFSAKTKGTAASDAVFAGTGVILGDMGLSRGMRPADKDSLTKYLQAGAAIKNDYEEFAKEKGRRSPFDIYNQYSFLGKLARASTAVSSTDTPLLAALYNTLHLLPSAVGTIGESASAIYYLQPDELDPSRLQCNDAEYKEIGIDADVACNIRVSMSDEELKADPKQVLEYMLKAHPDETREGIQELQQRLGKTDGWENKDKPEVQQMLSEAQQGANGPMIDKKTGKPMPHSEFEKFMDYCVNREDPWGRSAVVVRREALSEQEKEERMKTKDENATPRVEGDKGEVHEEEFKELFMSITWGTKADQDWYTGKKCLEDSEMLTNFRAYTMMCSVDGSLSGALDCTEKDDAQDYNYDGFFANNNILYTNTW